MNLTQTAKVARTTIAVTAVGLILYFIGYITFPALREAIWPLIKGGEKPVLLYGALPKIKLEPLKTLSSDKPQYNLNTKDGQLPSITPELLNVFKVTVSKPSFAAGQNAINKASILKFTSEENTSGFTGNIYTWLDRNLSRELTINITSNTLDYKVILSNLDTSKFTTGPSVNDESQSTAKSILTSLGYFKDPLYNRGSTNPKVTFGKFQSGRVLETTAPIEIGLVKVDFVRTIFKNPILGPRPETSPLSVTYAKSSEPKFSYLALSAHEWEIDTQTFGRYTPLSIQEAWKKVSNNEGLLTRAKLKTASVFEEYQPVNISRIFIDRVYLGYYDSLSFQEYLQPIYVFEGTFLTPDNQPGDITIYYPAVSPKLIKEK